MECRRAHHLSRRLILDPKQQMPSALVPQRHAVFVELAVVELRLRFLELQILVFGTGRPPSINL
jgi:hypothetical protein